MALVRSDFSSALSKFMGWGFFWLVVATVGAFVFFSNGISALFVAWQTPEYSHGPLIPVISAFLFLRQLKEYPVDLSADKSRWQGLVVVVFALLFGALGVLANIDDLVAYALILWVGGILLISFGWKTGREFWPPVLHLVYMLPLPGVVYYKVTTYLQFISSELGVWFLRLFNVPVFLEGNIIDLGVVQLHVAEACSGLRYMFPILSFSYIFAVLYRGPIWHKAVLLVSAVPIAIVMNSVRIAVAGIIVQHYGDGWLEGFTHFFEGWVIFVLCVIILFILAWVLLFLRRDKLSLAEALDLNTEGLGPQFMRLRHVMPSKAMIWAAGLGLVFMAAAWSLPERGAIAPEREPFVAFPRQIEDWSQQGPRKFLNTGVEETLAANDYHQVTLVSPNAAQSVGLFMAYYNDQTKNGVHSPEICLPGAGWEIAWLERSDLTSEMGSDVPFLINRAIIQKGQVRMMVYYWFQQRERRIAWDFAAKYYLVVDGITTGRTDGALVRLTTVIGPDETEEAANARLLDALKAIDPKLPRFIPGT